MSQGTTKGIAIDTDGTMSANTDFLVPSQKAVKTYAQPKSTPLTEISGLSPNNDDLLQRKSGSWVNRTLAQLWTDLKDLAVTLTNKTIALGSNTISGTKAQFNTACTDGDFLFIEDATHRQYVNYSNIDSSVTGSTNQTVLANLKVTGGDIGANGKLSFFVQMSKTGTAGSVTYRAYVSTVGTNTVGNTGTPTSSTLIGTRTIASTALTGGIFTRQLVNKNSESLNKVFPATVDATNDVATSTSAMTTVDINTANDFWVVITAQLANSGDTGIAENVQIYIDKP